MKVRITHEETRNGRVEDIGYKIAPWGHEDARRAKNEVLHKLWSKTGMRPFVKIHKVKVKGHKEPVKKYWVVKAVKPEQMLSKRVQSAQGDKLLKSRKIVAFRVFKSSHRKLSGSFHFPYTLFTTKR